jgi:hypothetical protein
MGFDCHDVGVQSLAATMVGWTGEMERDVMLEMEEGMK